MYYCKDGCLYVKDGDKFVNVQVTAVNKVVEVKELGAITVNRGETVDVIDDAIPLSMDEVKAKFHLDEEHPILFAKTKRLKKKD